MHRVLASPWHNLTPISSWIFCLLHLYRKSWTTTLHHVPLRPQIHDGMIAISLHFGCISFGALPYWVEIILLYFFGFFCWFREIVGILKKWKLLWFAEGVEATAWSISWQYEDNCYVADGTWNLDSVNVSGEYAVAKILIPSLNLAYVADRSSPSISILVV